MKHARNRLSTLCAGLIVLFCLQTDTFVSISSGQALPNVEQLPERPELPDPFVFFESGKPVSPLQWTARKAELRRLFQHYVYGYLPPEPAVAKLTITQRAKLLNDRAELIEVDFEVGPQADRTVTLHFAIVRPVSANGPVPVVLALNKCGNHEILPSDAITFQERDWRHSGCKNTQRGEKTDYWCVEQLIERGYAFATCHVADIDPDQNDFTDGVHPLYADWFATQDIAPRHRWGTIAAWAWGLHRGVDVLSELPEIDDQKIAILGHSRRGKTALFAAAMDERIALVVPHQSGTGGMALSRDNDQETVERITRVFPHWFNGQFQEFSNREAKLPIDQHLLIALVAPRPVMETSGLQDTWANFDSSFIALQIADTVYKALGVDGLKRDTPFTAADPITPDSTGQLLQYRLDTKHVLTAGYWEAILDFADRHFEN